MKLDGGFPLNPYYNPRHRQIAASLTLDNFHAKIRLWPGRQVRPPVALRAQCTAKYFYTKTFYVLKIFSIVKLKKNSIHNRLLELNFCNGQPLRLLALGAKKPLYATGW